MKSHTVPKRLLKQFCYHDAVTASLRLWQYSKGRKPHGRASPESATRIDGIYANPDDASVEAAVETRLAREIEQPVTQFMTDISDPAFVLTDRQRLALTRYIFVLFQRSQARKSATSPMTDVKIHALEAFLGNAQQLATVAAHWSIQAFFEGHRFERLITSEDVAKAARSKNQFNKSERGLQQAFVEGIVQQLSHVDPRLLAGEWRWIRTQPGDPFMLSDSPVITFARSPVGTLDYGMGFHEPNVEAALPISPTVCLHVLPDVRRTRATQIPTSLEINRGEAGFASNACYCNDNYFHLDAIMQADGAKWRMGDNIFTLPKKNYTNIFYDILMGIRQPQNW